MSTLLNIGTFVLRSGRKSFLKIDCDAMPAADIEAAAAALAALCPPFSEVEGVPTGGLRLAEALRKHARPGYGLLVAEDVFTTGGSVRRFINRLHSEGRITSDPPCAVIFARGTVPPWVHYLFRLNPLLDDA